MSTHNLANQIDSVKHKLTDKEYKSLMEETSKLNKLIMVKCKLTIIRNASFVRYDYIKDDNLTFETDECQHTICIHTSPKVLHKIEILTKENYEKILENIKANNYHYLECRQQSSFVNIRQNDSIEDTDAETEVCVVHDQTEICTHIEIVQESSH